MKHSVALLSGEHRRGCKSVNHEYGAGYGLAALLLSALTVAGGGHVAQAQPTSRPSATATLGEAVAQHMTKAARELRLTPLEADAGLTEATRLLASRGGCEVPPHALIQAALWQAGVVEPVHRLLLTRYATSAPADLLDGLPVQLRTALSSRGGGSGPGRWSRYGFASHPYDAEMSCGVLIILETFVKLTPPARSQPLSASPLSLNGTLLSPYKKSRVVITTPTGETQALSVRATAASKGEGENFAADFRCDRAGRYQIEVLGEDRAGPTVLANFPLFCGQPAPDFASLASAAGSAENAADAGRIWQCNGDAQALLLSLLNSERESAGRKPLRSEARLTAAAQAHSEDMRAHHYVSHVSPRTGAPADRARRAGIAAGRITENLAQAATPQLAHSGLMGSPGHRANILDTEIDHVGIGCAIAEPATPGQSRTLIVTQLFAALSSPTALSPQAASEALLHVNRLRTQGQLSALNSDAQLQALAQQIAAASMTEKDYDTRGAELVKAALPRLAGHFARLRLGLIGVLAATDFGPVRSFMEPALTHIGVAVRPFPSSAGKSGPGPRGLVIVVLGEKQ